MKDDGTNYWYVEATNATGTTRYPSSGNLSFTVTPQQTSEPDLVVQSLSVSDTTPTPGQNFTISATVLNQGDDYSDSTTLNYYLSSDSNIDTADILLNNPPDHVRGLAAEETSEELEALKAPSDAGYYWVGACVEPVNNESKIDNNCSAGLQITVSNPIYYALKVVKAGIGSGTVNSRPAGIICGNGSNDCTATYTADTSVLLTAAGKRLDVYRLVGRRL